MPNSLAARLFISFALWTLLVLPVTAIFLTSGYRGELENGFDEDLNQYLIYLIDRTFPEKGVEVRAPNLGEPLFSFPFSGRYWQIKPLGVSEAPLIKSESLVTEVLKLPSEMGVNPDSRLVRFADITGPDNQKLRIIEREVSLSEGTETRSYSYAVAIDKVDVDLAIRDFTVTLTLNLMVLGFGLLAATIFQVRYGLWPLRDIGKRLSAIRSGEAEKLEGQLPQEIMPLQVELNALIQSNNHIIDRARTHVGNLAHALKTPLSVIINEARSSDPASADKIIEQASLMREHIDHHLNRARIAASSGAVSSVTPVRPALQSLVNALTKIYSERQIGITLDCRDDLRFQGEKQDFEEMAGNLLDNACKWARTQVTVSASHAVDRARPSGRTIVVIVDDDGRGMTEDQRAGLIRRGRRFDETTPGTGLGLSIVADLADLYQGRLCLEESPHGGLRARLTLPSA